VSKTSFAFSAFQGAAYQTIDGGNLKMETSILEQANAALEVVNARLDYLVSATPKPVNYAYDPPAGVPRSSGKHVAQNVAIRDARELLDELSLDTNGFVLTPHETAVKDFYDSEEVKAVYYPEAERLLKRVTGAERVVIFRSHRTQSGTRETR
jgi:hypothetical protein